MDLRSAPWYYLHVEDEGTITQRGPIPFDELHVLYKDGGVEKDTFVWNEDPRGPAFESEDFFQIESRPELLALLETPLNTGGAVEAQDDPPTSVTQSLPEENADDAEGITATTVNVEHPREQASAPEPTTRPTIVPATSAPTSTMRTPTRSQQPSALEAIMRRVGASTVKKSPLLMRTKRLQSGDGEDEDASDASSIDDDLDDDLDIGIQAGKKKWFPDVENALNVEYAALKRALHKDYVAHVSKLERSLENIEARVADAKERRAIERRESAKERKEHERLARSAGKVAVELERVRRREDTLSERERSVREREDEIAAATDELAAKAEDVARREHAVERRERMVHSDAETLDQRSRELDAEFDACENVRRECKDEKANVVAEHKRAMRELSELERRLEEDARRIAAEGEALARRAEEDRRRVKEREHAIERREAAIEDRSEKAEAALAMEREAVRMAIGERFENMERSRRNVIAVAAREAEAAAWNAVPQPPPPPPSGDPRHPATELHHGGAPSSFTTPRRSSEPPPVSPAPSVLTGAGARWQAGVPSPAAAAAVRKGAVLVPVYRGGMPGPGTRGVRIGDVALTASTTLGGLRTALGSQFGLKDGFVVRRRRTTVPRTQDHLPASTYFGSYDDAVVLD